MTFRKKHNLFMGIYALSLLLVVILAVDCSYFQPKNLAEKKIEFPEAVYEMITDTLPFRFALSDQAVFSARENKEGEYFCDIVYPNYKAQLYCTWHRINPEQVILMSEESRRLAYQHTAMATDIRQKQYNNDLSRTFGTLYEIEGDVATPLQLALTDSVSYFFNGSLYFNTTPNADSIAPFLEHIRKDVVYLMETFTPVYR